MVDFSQLKNSRVHDADGADLGKLKDLVFIDGKNYAEITHLIYEDESKYKRKIPWGYVKDVKEEQKHLSVHLNSSINDITPFFMKEKESLVGDILDKQVIDVNGVKLVRVNDILLGKVDTKFCIVAVAVGATSFVKRLGFKRLVELAPLKINSHIIPWKSVERLDPEFHDLHVKIQKDKISDLHPEDIADIMEDLSRSERVLIFNSLTERKAAKTLIKAEEGVQDSVLKSFKMNKIKDLLENVPADQAADIISLMPKEKGEEILKTMTNGVASRIRKILNYYPESIGSIMKTDVLSIPKTYTAQQTINYLRKIKPTGSIYNIYVVDNDKHLIGVISVRALIIANPKSKVEEFMNRDVIFVKDNNPKETAARLMARYDLFVLPVVDKEGILRGIVKSDDILDEYIPKKLKKEKFLPSKLKQG